MDKKKFRGKYKKLNTFAGFIKTRKIAILMYKEDDNIYIYICVYSGRGWWEANL